MSTYSNCPPSSGSHWALLGMQLFQHSDCRIWSEQCRWRMHAEGLQP
jgi:hypothetical protein